MNKFSNQTSGRYARTAIRHGRCRARRGQTFGHPEELAGTRRPGDHARRGHHDHSGPGRSRRAVHQLHKALADVARTGDKQLRGEAAQIVTEATSRLNGLLATDRGHLA